MFLMFRFQPFYWTKLNRIAQMLANRAIDLRNLCGRRSNADDGDPFWENWVLLGSDVHWYRQQNVSLKQEMNNCKIWVDFRLDLDDAMFDEWLRQHINQWSRLVCLHSTDFVLLCRDIFIVIHSGFPLTHRFWCCCSLCFSLKEAQNVEQQKWRLRYGTTGVSKKGDYGTSKNEDQKVTTGLSKNGPWRKSWFPKSSKMFDNS